MSFLLEEDVLLALALVLEDDKIIERDVESAVFKVLADDHWARSRGRIAFFSGLTG
jgi:hypothetical protein